MKKEDRIKMHLEFCKKYPETVVEANLLGGIQYMIDNNITPSIDCFKVTKMNDLYKINSNFFYKFKDIIKDWNNLIYNRTSLEKLK